MNNLLFTGHNARRNSVTPQKNNTAPKDFFARSTQSTFIEMAKQHQNRSVLVKEGTLPKYKASPVKNKTMTLEPPARNKTIRVEDRLLTLGK